jgi:threonine dehydrogenase-like Zn-dependent dehydrogenase
VVRAESVGICGTDLSIHAGKIPVDYPRVMGHEIVGTVYGAGGGLDEGTTVLVDPGIACGRCRQCLEGRTNICTAGWLIGRDRDGGLREQMTVPESNVHPLPDGLDPGIAPMLQVLATCVHAQRRTDVFPDESVVVLGLGVTGLLHLQLAKLRRLRRYVATSTLLESEDLRGDILIQLDSIRDAWLAERAESAGNPPRLGTRDGQPSQDTPNGED